MYFQQAINSLQSHPEILGSQWCNGHLPQLKPWPLIPIRDARLASRLEHPKKLLVFFRYVFFFFHGFGSTN